MARETAAVPDHIEIRGAKVHNLKGVDVDIRACGDSVTGRYL